MSAVLAAALVLPPQGAKVKYLDIDKFDTPPYSVTLSGNGFDLHDWPGLSFDQCWFYRRSNRIQINANPNHTTLTFSIENGGFAFASPLKVYWSQYLSYFPQNGQYADFGSVSRVYVDLDQVPDIAELYAVDRDYKSYLSGPLGHSNGIYFNVGSTSIDWKHLRNLEFRLDFGSVPNPLSFRVSRIYARLKPEALPPAQFLRPQDG